MGPLLSWDIFMMGYHKKIGHFSDLQELAIMSNKYAWDIPYDLEAVLLRKRAVILVTDPFLSIRFASSNLSEMNGYEPREVKGKTPAMFQGKDTSESTKAQIREAIRELQPFHVSMINYRRNGTVYACDLQAFPVFNKQRQHVHFMAFEKPIDE